MLKEYIIMRNELEKIQFSLFGRGTAKGVKMELKHDAIAGTLESSDVQVKISPSNGLTLHIESAVMAQFGRQIEESVRDVLSKLSVTDAEVEIRDKGALDCTIRARVQTAVFRAADRTEDLPWRTKL